VVPSRAYNKHWDADFKEFKTAGRAMKKGKLKTARWDVVDYPKTDEDMANYRDTAMEDGHPAVIATAIGKHRPCKGNDANSQGRDRRRKFL
jgi:hypothetical protein